MAKRDKIDGKFTIEFSVDKTVITESNKKKTGLAEGMVFITNIQTPYLDFKQ